MDGVKNGIKTFITLKQLSGCANQTASTVLRPHERSYIFAPSVPCATLLICLLSSFLACTLSVFRLWLTVHKTL